jgi:putative inorganic carbon (hco3(-)) transporter
MVHALLVSLVPVGALAALAGTSPASALPILAAAALAFLMTGARVGDRDTRLLDAALVALVAGVVLQLVPLPGATVALASPRVDALRGALYLESTSSAATLTVNPIATRAGLASLASVLLLFWAARDAFGRGGLRMTASAIAWAGSALVIVSLVQRATAPRTLLWIWTPADAEAQPFGPFVNPNHLATWLLMAAPLTAGYLVSHTRAIGSSQASLRLRVRDWLADGKGLLLAGALLTMVLGIGATLSRAALLGAGAALAAAVWLCDVEHRGRTARIVGAAAAVLAAVSIWFNGEALAGKFDAVTTFSRFAIWRQTLPVIRDFWLTGTGAGTYAATMLHYQRAFREVHFNQAHSEYVQVAAEGGVLLVTPIVVALGAALRLARRRIGDDARPISWLRVGAAAGLVGTAVQGLFETGLRIPANALLAAVLAAIVLHQHQDRSDRSHRGIPSAMRRT